MKFIKIAYLVVFLTAIFLSSCTSTKTEPTQTSSTGTCYLTVMARGEYDELSVSSFSTSLISKFHKRVIEPPASGISSTEECVYEVRVDSREFTTLVTISSKDLNTSGDSKATGNEGLQESILRALYNGLSNKREEICQSYGEKLVECGVDHKKLEKKLKDVLDVEEKQLQEEIRLLEQDVNTIRQDRLRIEKERNAEIQRQKDEATKKREEELRILREKEEKRKQEELARKRAELKKKQEEKERIRRIEELRIQKEKLEREREENERSRLEEERKQREFEEKGYVPYHIRVRGLIGSSSSGSTSVSNTSFYGIWKNYGIGFSGLSYKTKSSSNNKFEMNNSFLDLSYTYEEDWTATAGFGFVTGGSGEITLSPSGLIYETTDVSGFSLFGIFGMEWDRIEGLVGLRYDNINYSGFNSKNSLQNDSLTESYPISGMQFILGVGYSF